MLRSLARFSGPESLVHTRSLADFITTTSGCTFSVHTSRAISTPTGLTHERGAGDRRPYHAEQRDPGAWANPERRHLRRPSPTRFSPLPACACASCRSTRASSGPERHLEVAEPVMNLIARLRKRNRQHDPVEVARGWLDDFGGVALATVVSTWGSAPVPVSGQLVVAPGERFEGSVSGGASRST